MEPTSTETPVVITPAKKLPIVPFIGILALVILGSGGWYFTQPALNNSSAKLSYEIVEESHSDEFSERGLLETRFSIRVTYPTVEGLPGTIRLNYGLACKRVGEALTEELDTTTSVRTVTLDCLSPEPLTTENDPGDWFAYEVTKDAQP